MTSFRSWSMISCLEWWKKNWIQQRRAIKIRQIKDYLQCSYFLFFMCNTINRSFIITDFDKEFCTSSATVVGIKIPVLPIFFTNALGWNIKPWSINRVIQCIQPYLCWCLLYAVSPHHEKMQNLGFQLIFPYDLSPMPSVSQNSLNFLYTNLAHSGKALPQWFLHPQRLISTMMERQDKGNHLSFMRQQVKVSCTSVLAADPECLKNWQGHPNQASSSRTWQVTRSFEG